MNEEGGRSPGHGERGAGFRWTIKRKLLALGGGTLLPLLLLLAYWAWWEVREHRETLQAGLTLASEQGARHAETAVAQLERHLVALARHPAVQRGQVARMEEIFRAVVADHPEIENVVALDTDGSTRATALPLPSGAEVSIADRSWFPQVVGAGRLVVGDFQIGRIVNQPVAVVAVPLRAEDGAVVGALAAPVSLRRLHGQFEFLPLADGMTLTVVDGEGRILSHQPPAEGWIGRRLPSAAALPSKKGVVAGLGWPEGGERLAGVAPVARTGWRVVVAVPRASLEARVWKEAASIVLPLLALLVASAVVGLAVARRIWRPLQALTEAAAFLPRGERMQVRVDSTDEVGDLARAFSAMAAEVRESRSSLEQRVSELTTLSEAGRLLTGVLDLSGVLQRLTELARTRLGAHVVRIWLHEGSPGTFRLHAQAGATKESEVYRLHLGPGEGLVGWIMNRREPLVVDDVLADLRLQHRVGIEAEGLHAFLGVPIFLEDAPIGVLACMSRERGAFSRDDVTLAGLFALPAALAIRNARLYEESRARASELAERNQHLRLLHEAARAMTAEQDLNRLLQRIVETAREFLGAGYGALALFREDGTVAHFFTAGLTPEERARIARLPEGRGLLGHVFQRGERLRLDDLASHPAAMGFPPGHPPMRTLLAVPIRFREETLGAVYLTEKPGGFTADDESLLTTLSTDAALAIENARLVSSLRRALDDLGAAQDQLVREETLRALGAMASGVAHHLNNILAVIQGRVQLLLRKVAEPSIGSALERIEHAALEGAEVVRRVQEFGGTRVAFQRIPVDLNRVVEEAAELVRRGTSIDVTVEAGSLPPVTGDPASLKEALVNLLLNAVDARPAAGRIVVRTWASGTQVHCSVTDTGVGMSEDVRRRALEPFFTTKGPRSRGLGLSVSHGIVQRHGGDLALESAEGGGTVVTISLPIADPPPSPAPGHAPPSAPASSRRILVINDDAEMLDTLADGLAGNGYRVSVAASGAEGMAMFRAEPHDLVVTDLGMPGMTGWQVAEAIKALSPATPVILLTGWAGEIPTSEMGARGVDEIVAKPFDLDAIAAVIARALRGAGG